MPHLPFFVLFVFAACVFICRLHPYLCFQFAFAVCICCLHLLFVCICICFFYNSRTLSRTRARLPPFTFLPAACRLLPAACRLLPAGCKIFSKIINKKRNRFFILILKNQLSVSLFGARHFSEFAACRFCKSKRKKEKGKKEGNRKKRKRFFFNFSFPKCRWSLRCLRYPIL